VRFCVTLFPLFLCLSASPAIAETVLVAPFANSTGDKSLDPLSWGFRDILEIQLARHDGLNVVARGHLRAVLNEQALSLSGLRSKDSALRVGQLLAANRLVTGSIIRKESELIVVAHVYDIASWQLVESVKESGELNNPLGLALGVAKQINRVLGVEFHPVISGKTEDDPVSSVHFLRGLGLFYAGNYDGAIAEFMQTNRLNPPHEDSAYFIAKSYESQGEDSHAKIACQRYLTTFQSGRYRTECQEMIGSAHN